MKKINDEILKYLSGMMSDSEMKLFEEKLKISEELNSQLNCVREVLAEFDIKNINADETYFNNLVPRIRQRMDSGKKYHLRKKLYYLVPALTIILLAIVFYPRNNNNLGNNLHELAEVVVNNIDDSEVTDKYSNYIILDASYNTLLSNKDFTVGLENSNEAIPDSYFKLVDYSNTETLRALDNLPEEDLEKLYAELSNIKFQ